MSLASNRYSAGVEFSKDDVLTIDELLVDSDPSTPEEKQKEDHLKFEDHVASIVKRLVPQFSKIRGVKDINIIYFKDGITNKRNTNDSHHKKNAFICSHLFFHVFLYFCVCVCAFLIS